MIRDGSKNGISLKAGLHALMPHTILPLSPYTWRGRVAEKKEIPFLTKSQSAVWQTSLADARICHQPGWSAVGRPDHFPC